jgi:uncharacterized protein YjiK
MRNMNAFCKKILPALAVVFSVTSCTTEGKVDKTLNDYDLHSPEKFFMPESLFEISGITFDKGEADTVYAIQDEAGILYRLATGIKKQEHAKFGKKGDYEDLTIIRSQVVILKSNGTLLSFPLTSATDLEVDSVKEWKGLLPKGEYEGIYGDEKTGELFVLCKNCQQDDSKVSITGTVLQLADSVTQKGNFHIDVTQIIAQTGKMKAGFRPSGIAQNPLTKEWFIISAINKMVAVFDSNWKLKETAHLDVTLFNQPEGIIFDKSGNLYISNEGGDISEGNILKFKRLAK